MRFSDGNSSFSLRQNSGPIIANNVAAQIRCGSLFACVFLNKFALAARRQPLFIFHRMARSTVTHGCLWNCCWHKGEQKPWCCHRCVRTGGLEHNPYCESQQGRQAVHVHRRKSRSPKPPDFVRMSSTVRDRSTDVQLPRTIITCGKQAFKGKSLLRLNPRLRNPKWCYDVTEALHDRFHAHNSPDGTYAETQRRISRLEGFADVHTWILSTLLRERYTVVICNHGRHRSVAAAELAVQDLQRVQHCNFQIEIIHIDLKEFVEEHIWNRLCAVFSVWVIFFIRNLALV